VAQNTAYGYILT